MATLPDWLREDMKILSIGLNPSIISVERGFYFANPRNRFWKALNLSGLAGCELEPGIGAEHFLLEHCGIGFTDIVKRPTPGLRDLTNEDFARDAPLLQEKIEKLRPRVAWFHGSIAYGRYQRHVTGRSPKTIVWGEQFECIGSSRVFVSPNPSPANAAFSLQVLAQWYRELADFAAAVSRRE